MIAPLLRISWELVGAAAACASLPGSVELLGLTLASLLPRRTRRAAAVSSQWSVAVVVPAHNEAANIASCVRSLLASETGGMHAEVYVVADNCSDNTAQVAEAAGARVLVRHNPAERGKGYALHFAFTELASKRFDCVLVVDADTVVAPNFIACAAGAMRDGADAVQVRYLVRNAGDGIRTRLMRLALCAWNVVRPLGRERAKLSVGLLGNGFGLRLDTIRAVPYLASSVVEDLEYHLSLVQAGLRVEFVDSTAVFGEIPVRGEGVKTQRARWEGGRFRMIRETAPKLLRGVISGKLIFLEPLLELLLLPLAFHVTLLAIAASTPLPLIRDIGLGGLAVVALHLFAAIIVGGGTWRDLATLAAAPFYIVWKLTMVPSLLRNSAGSQAWVRTKRNAEVQLAGEPEAGG